MVMGRCRNFAYRQIPELGTIMPNMGTKVPKSGRKAAPNTGLADALFTRTQQAVLALLFGQPDRSFFKTEIIRKAGMGSGAVQRELERLEKSGLAEVRNVGNQKHYQANPASPLFAELASISQKTFGIAEPLRAALQKWKSKITAAFVYGSLAKRADTSRSDIDVMIISDELTYADVFAAFEPVAEKLGRPINPTIHTRKEWSRQLKEDNSFHIRISRQPKIWLFGSELPKVEPV